MLKRILLCLVLLGCATNVQADLSNGPRIIGLVCGGSFVAAASAWGATWLMSLFNGTGFADRSWTTTSGALAAGYAVWALASQRFLEATQMDPDFHNTAKVISLLIGGATFVALNK